ncbi:NADH-quinone oxidoreductase subunit J [Pseudoprevotella muciniphila]|uniref:NADH-quinone oxidoreductase subunit J n=1 Tax=Pseudoprevotella muciniphila TaxID=2133944 RepID=A0A5P8E657_9BACT|nr:NADH-quinone oxidoreductase subunit J [Pseudoprevotella muciniphila]QFQ12406.1 NADH-quinone oxidoreductase subunit J [Pseudoprevotella muciniphila]
MDSYNIMFIVLAVVIVISSIVTVTARSIMRSTTALFFTLLGTAGIYFMLGYTFLGAVQIMVYAGGIIVLYVFAILLTRGSKDQLSENSKTKIALSAILSIVGFGLVVFLIFTSHLRGALLEPVQGPHGMTMQYIGENLLSSGEKGYLLPFEAVSLLLLACIVAGLMVARKR